MEQQRTELNCAGNILVIRNKKKKKKQFQISSKFNANAKSREIKDPRGCVGEVEKRTRKEKLPGVDDKESRTSLSRWNVLAKQSPEGIPCNRCTNNANHSPERRGASTACLKNTRDDAIIPTSCLS